MKIEETIHLFHCLAVAEAELEKKEQKQRHDDILLNIAVGAGILSTAFLCSYLYIRFVF